MAENTQKYLANGLARMNGRYGSTCTILEESLLLALYRGLTNLGGPIIHGYLVWRRQHGKEDPFRFGERLGQPGQSRPHGPLVWLHAASVGESLSLLPLLDALLARWPVLSALITTGSVSSARLMAERLPARACHQYMPVDRAVYLQRFLEYWHPTLVLWAESEFWPNAIIEIWRRAIPLVLINGRMSEHSFRRWRWWPQEIRSMLAAFDLCLGQTGRDRDRLAALGAQQSDCVGNLKFAAPPLPAEPEALLKLQHRLAGRLVWLAASTHAGEEAAVGRVHQRLTLHYPRLLTLIVPRHPVRGMAVIAQLTAAGLRVARWSADEPVPSDSGLYVADTLGELGLFFRIAPVVFIGKSLLGRGGQNPLEAARLGCAVLFGPHMNNFADIATRMIAAGAACTVADEADLAAKIATLLVNTTACTAMGAAGQAVAVAEATALPRLLARLAPYFESAAASPEHRHEDP